MHYVRSSSYFCIFFFLRVDTIYCSGKEEDACGHHCSIRRIGTGQGIFVFQKASGQWGWFGLGQGHDRISAVKSGQIVQLVLSI